MGRKLFVICAALLSAGCVSAATIVAGGPATKSNFFPFGAAYTNEYQQVYMSSVFSGLGTISITGLIFYADEGAGNGAAINSGDWTISLSTTLAKWDTLSTTPTQNIGSDNTTVFSGSLARPLGSGRMLEIVFTQPFTYDPTQGNLLMDVWASNVVAPVVGNIPFELSDENRIMGRVYYNSVLGAYYPTFGAGLVTGFTYSAAGASEVPEPASVVLMGFALLVLATVVTRFPQALRPADASRRPPTR
jgi:hypothetical protein